MYNKGHSLSVLCSHFLVKRPVLVGFGGQSQGFVPDNENVCRIVDLDIVRGVLSRVQNGLKVLHLFYLLG